MQKVMIAAHRSQAGQLISALQDAGIVQILDAERAMVSKEWPELEMEIKRPREMEELVGRLDKAVVFLKQYIKDKNGRSVFQPLIEIDKKTYTDIVLGSSALILLENTEQTQSAIEKLNSRAEAIHSEVQKLSVWKDLQTPVEQLGQLNSTVCLAGILPKQHFNAAVEAVSQIGAAVQVVGGTVTIQPCLVFGMKESAQEIQKILRSFEFEAVGFEWLKGTAAENLSQRQNDLAQIDTKLKEAFKAAGQLAGEKLKLEILADHYQNVLVRKQTQATAPATETTLFLESWVRRKDYPKLVKILESFDGADVVLIGPAEGEEVPVEIENASMIRPFESVTRLYGMPIPSSIDPTVFLAPFFALFFGLCMTDAGYGVVMIIILTWILKKLQGDKKALWMLIICSFTTIASGVIMGSWFADTIQRLLPQTEGSIGATLNQWRVRLMLFDPMEKPLIFVGISLALGYIQIIFGLFISFINLLMRKEYATAVFDKLTWLIYLNCILVFALAKGGLLPPAAATFAGVLALIQAGLIFWFTDRSGSMAGRIGNGVFAVFSTVFYLGDILSYVRLMALGLVGAGLGMAINILTRLLMDIPYVGFVIGMLFFVVGHLVNIGLSMLSAFVHSLRLQFVEFFPKFFVAGGAEFKPLRNDYRHIMVVDHNQSSKEQ